MTIDLQYILDALKALDQAESILSKQHNTESIKASINCKIARTVLARRLNVVLEVTGGSDA